MQQLQEDIKKDIIKHATRNIEIVYESGKATITEQDEKFLAAYTQLHDFELKMKKTADKLYHEFIPVNKTLDTLHDELTKAQATFNDCCTLADKLGDASFAVGETSLEKLAKSQLQTEKELVAYGEKITQVWEVLDLLSKEVAKYNEENEEGADNLYSTFSEIRLAHSINWQNNAINIAAFEDEYERFLSYRSVHEGRRETLMDYCDSALDEYTSLNQQTTALYNVWKEFIKRCNLLRAVADLHAKSLSVSNN